ncbi:MAG: hypothetical protein HYX68_10705 [Planctomycetes bacterium]|nr:hypothetical protein [Planctomycetota bacterium]
MTKIVLTPDQAKLYHQAREPVQICDSHGTVICTVPPVLSAEYIAELERRTASEPSYSGDEIQAMFRFLEESWSKEGAFDEQRMNQLLDQFDVQRKHDA